MGFRGRGPSLCKYRERVWLKLLSQPASTDASMGDELYESELLRHQVKEVT